MLNHSSFAVCTVCRKKYNKANAALLLRLRIAASISPPQKPSLALAKMYCNRNGYETCFKFARVEMLLFCHRVNLIRSPILHDSVVLCAENSKHDMENVLEGVVIYTF